MDFIVVLLNFPGYHTDKQGQGDATIYRGEDGGGWGKQDRLVEQEDMKMDAYSLRQSLVCLPGNQIRLRPSNRDVTPKGV